MTDDVIWMDYSGAPALLIPDSLKHQWRGFYLRAEPGESGIPDLELADGAYNIHDEFDFDNPRTDYDRACATNLGENHEQTLTQYFISIGPGKGLVFSSGEDNHAWWAAQNMVVSGGGLPDPDKLDNQTWEEALVWDIEEDALTLMNACNHGLEPDIDFTPVRLPAGRHVIERACYIEGDDSLILHRFTCTGRRRATNALE